MELTLPDPPDGALKLVQQYLDPSPSTDSADLDGDDEIPVLATETHRTKTTVADGKRGRSLRAARPIPVYSLLPSDLIQDEPPAGKSVFRNRVPDAWQYVLLEEDQPRMIAEVLDPPAPVTLGFGAIYSGRSADALVRAIGRAERSANARPEKSYELRILRCLPLRLLTVWLHGDGRDDVHFPISPTPYALRGKLRLTEDRLLAVMRSRAENFLNGTRRRGTGARPSR